MSFRGDIGPVILHQEGIVDHFISICSRLRAFSGCHGSLTNLACLEKTTQILTAYVVRRTGTTTLENTYNVHPHSKCTDQRVAVDRAGNYARVHTPPLFNL